MLPRVLPQTEIGILLFFSPSLIVQRSLALIVVLIGHSILFHQGSVFVRAIGQGGVWVDIDAVDIGAMG